MKILMVNSELLIGGTETHILSISQALKAIGYEIGIATAGGVMVTAFKQNGIQVHILPELARSPGNAGASLKKVVTENQYQLVHAHDTRSFQAVTSLYRLLQVPTVLSVHGLYYWRPVLVTAGKIAKRIITVSEAVSNQLVGYGVDRTKLIHIPNGINIRYYAPQRSAAIWKRKIKLPSNAQIVLYAGRFAPDKYKIAREAILASETVCKKNKNLYFILVGPGVYRNALFRLGVQANKRIGRQAIQVRPASGDMRTFYHAADLVIGTGRVTLEALACGKPVIAVGIKGYCGIVSEHTIRQAMHGNFGDHSAARRMMATQLAQDVQSLLARPAYRRILGQFGRQTVLKSYSIQNVVRKINQIYSS